MIQTDPSFRQIDERQSLVLGHIFEVAYLIDRNSDSVTNLGSFYGDPSFGLISFNLDWCLVGGSYLCLWHVGYIVHIEDDELKGACNARQVGAFEVELLIDPWSDNGSVWQLNVETFEILRLKTMDKRNEPYSEDVEW